MVASNKRLQIALLIFALIGFVASVSICIYYRSIFGTNVSHNHNVWAEFGSFFGGTAGPIFGLLSLLALLYTIYIQTVELRRSSKAQEEATNYSRLNALVILCSHYREEIPKMENHANQFAGTASGVSSGNEGIETRRLLSEVMREIEKYHSELIKKMANSSEKLNGVNIAPVFQINSIKPQFLSATRGVCRAA